MQILFWSFPFNLNLYMDKSVKFENKIDFGAKNRRDDE